MRHAHATLAAAAALVLLPIGQATAAAGASTLLGSRVVTDEALDTIRGGFTTSDGAFKIAFGVERAVYANGELLSSTRISGASAGPLGGAAVAPIQLGAGNTFAPISLDAATAAATAVIQNTLDNQKLQTITSINVQANSLQALRGMNLQTSVGHAVVDSLRR